MPFLSLSSAFACGFPKLYQKSNFPCRVGSLVSNRRFASEASAYRSLRVLHRFDFGTVALHHAQIFYWAAVWGLVFLSVAFLEEYLFRGYALFTLADGLGFWPAAIILAVLFAYFHTGNPGETRMGIIGVAAFALFVSATIRRTGNLWLAVGAHAGWDWAQSYFYGVSDSGVQVPGHLMDPRISGPDWLTGGSAGPEGSVLTLVLLVVMTGVFLAYGRLKPNSP